MKVEDSDEKSNHAAEYIRGRVKMNLWMETIGMLLIAVCGLVVGRWASKHSPTARITAMIVSFGIVGLILLARQYVLWELFPPLRPIAAGRLRFILLVLAVTVGLTAPLSQLRSVVSRFVTCIVMSILLAVLISLPFMGPALAQEDFSVISNRYDTDGVCRQSRSFTCGPAAAVTALRQFGLEASEGRLAIAARTSPLIGTSPWNLYRAVKSHYKDTGLECSFRYLDSLDAVPDNSIALVVIKDAVLIDHCVTVLDYNEQTVTLADPVEGRVLLPRSQFAQQRRKCGIILQRPL